MEHTTPSDAIFNEIKEAATKVWNTKDNTYGYVTEKLDRMKSITNVQDNVMFFYRAFDRGNQILMREHLSDEALSYIDSNN